MYDLIVLGGGPAGYLAAQRAAEAKMQVALIEKNKLGGVCLNEGCIPSKTLLNSAKIYQHSLQGQTYGVKAENVSYDQSAVIKRKNKVVKKLVAGIRAQLKAGQVAIFSAEGRILGRQDGGFAVQAGEELVLGRRLLIATGSDAIIPPIPGVQEGLAAGTVLTSREILDLEEIPESLVVIGGGVIGLEMAGYFQACGSQVTVIEMLDHIAGGADLELSAALQAEFTRQGIVFHLGCKVTAIGQGQVSYETVAGQKEQLAAAKVLLSVGRRPAVKNIGLESLGVFVDKGRIVTDRQGLTNVPDVYAAGDINGSWMLAHAAYREAEVAVNTMLGQKDLMRYQAMPSVIYTNPEMAFVGETEETCQAAGIAYKKLVLPLNYSGRYMAENEAGSGFIKLLIDPVRQRVLGCHILGAYASEIILAAGFIIETEMTLKEAKELIFPHPTVGEIIREAIFSYKD